MLGVLREKTKGSCKMKFILWLILAITFLFLVFAYGSYERENYWTKHYELHCPSDPLFEDLAISPETYSRLSDGTLSELEVWGAFAATIRKSMKIGLVSLSRASFLNEGC